MRGPIVFAGIERPEGHSAHAAADGAVRPRAAQGGGDAWHRWAIRLHIDPDEGPATGDQQHTLSRSWIPCVTSIPVTRMLGTTTGGGATTDARGKGDSRGACHHHGGGDGVAGRVDHRDRVGSAVRHVRAACRQRRRPRSWDGRPLHGGGDGIAARVDDGDGVGKLVRHVHRVPDGLTATPPANAACLQLHGRGGVAGRVDEPCGFAVVSVAYTRCRRS